MTAFQCIPTDTETAERFRRTGLDDNGNVLRRIVATPEGGFPCRHCLRLGKPGETMLLGSYNLPRPLGIYWTPSPIFLHAEACERFAASDEMVETVSTFCRSGRTSRSVAARRSSNAARTAGR